MPSQSLPALQSGRPTAPGRIVKRRRSGILVGRAIFAEGRLCYARLGSIAAAFIMGMAWVNACARARKLR
jgi:hypothetical protein